MAASGEKLAAYIVWLYWQNDKHIICLAKVIRKTVKTGSLPKKIVVCMSDSALML